MVDPCGFPEVLRDLGLHHLSVETLLAYISTTGLQVGLEIPLSVAEGIANDIQAKKTGYCRWPQSCLLS